MDPESDVSAVELPLVSVILPTYNRSSVLHRAVESVLTQTYRRFELIVVDDASTDGTERIIRELSDPRIRYVRHRSNRGGSAARNSGIECASGTYLCFLDDDDQYLPHKLDLMVRALEAQSNRFALAYSRTRKISAAGVTLLEGGPGRTGRIYDDYLAGNWFHTGSTLIRRTASPLFDPDLPRLQDVDYHLKILRDYDAVFCDSVTSVHHGHTATRISSDPLALEQALGIIENRFLGEATPDLRRRVRAFYFRYLGMQMVTVDSNAERGRMYLKKAFRLDPGISLLGSLLMGYLGTNALYRARLGWLRLKSRFPV